PRAKLLWRAHPWLFERDAVSLCGNGPSRRASAADAAGAHWTLVGCAIGIFFGQDSSPAPFCSVARERDNAGAKIDVADPRSRGGFGQQAGLGHSRNGVDLQDERLPVLRQNRVHPRVHLQTRCAKCAERYILNLFCFCGVDLRRANMLCSTARLRIEKRILVVEIVKAALGNYLENGQGLVTEDTYRQFPAGHKFFYQQFAAILSGFADRGFDFALALYNS